jgi:hypothetical protein
MSNSRISFVLQEFDADIKKFHDHLNSLEPDGITMRGITLGMTSHEMTTLNNYRKEWSTTDPANPGVYDLLLNPNTKTSTISTKVRMFMKNFKSFFQPLLNIMAVSRFITPEDRAALNIAEPVTSHTIPTAPIVQKCIASVTMLGGGKVKFICRPTTDIARASKAVGSDGLIIAYRLVAPIVDAGGDSSLTAGKVRRPEFSGPDDGTIKLTQTKATFFIEFGADKAAYILQFYVRWTNSKHPNLSGPWTGPYSEVLS